MSENLDPYANFPSKNDLDEIKKFEKYLSGEMTMKEGIEFDGWTEEELKILKTKCCPCTQVKFKDCECKHHEKEKEEDHTGHEKDMCDECANISYCIEDQCMFCIHCKEKEEER